MVIGRRKENVNKSEQSAVDISESPILTHGRRPWFDINVGEFVLKHAHETSKVSDSEFEFGVMKITPGKDEAAADVNDGKPYYVAATPYRHVVWNGETPEAAIGSMMRSLAMYARSGHMNPKYPCEPGDPPIQHVMNILSERLAWQIERRHDNLSEAARESELSDVQPELTPKAARSSDIIAALSTAIAALARVKDL
jgi:hypothetical protein